MIVQKLSISLPQQQCEFIENYRVDYQLKSRSEVIKEALCLLQQTHLEACYREANQELDLTFEGSSLDGLEENETW